MIKGPYHSAVRSLRAFRTTPIKNLLTEGGFQTIESRIKYLRSRIIYKLYSYSPNVLSREIQLLNKRKTAIKRKSALCEIKELAEFLKLSFSPPKLTPAKIPPWELDSKIFINELTLHHKDKTCQSNFQKLYTSIVTPLKQEGWSFLFTDGSKQKDGVSFAVTDENGLTQSHGLLPQYANIFDAELQGLISALQMAKETNKCYVICTDSKSVFLASQKFPIRDSPLQSVQQLLMSASPKIKLMWIPSHSGILGNEQADLAAKSSLKDCLHVFMPFDVKSLKTYYSNALRKHLNDEWSTYTHPYKDINPLGAQIKLPTNTSTWANRCFIRLRLGHTLITHEYILQSKSQPKCHFCNNNNLTIQHILSDCPNLHAQRSQAFQTQNTLPLILRHPSESNIRLIVNFLKDIKMFHLI